MNNNEFGKLIKREAPREGNYVKVIKNIASYESGRKFPMNEVVIAEKEINLLAEESDDLGGLNVATDKSVFRWLLRGDTLCDVTIPEEGKIYEVNNKSTNGGTLRASKIVLSNPRVIDDEMAFKLYETSDLPWKSYIQALAYISAQNFRKTSLKVFEDKINETNAKEALSIFDTFLERRSDPMPEVYLEILNKINDLIDK